jgi:hypothetical protein
MNLSVKVFPIDSVFEYRQNNPSKVYKILVVTVNYQTSGW